MVHTITLDAHADFEAWKVQARDLCAARIPPGQVRFAPPDRDDPILDLGMMALMNNRRNVVTSRDFMDRAERVACHSDPERYDRLYHLLWRLQAQPSLMRNTVDDDVRWMVEADKAIRRDRHKMHAFVRFRKVGDSETGRERFMAWFEPSHYIVDLATPFFTRRFPNMDWAIVTPFRTAVWDGEALRFEPGGTRDDVPDEDVVEEQWKTYFSSIFNPSRLKVAAMTAEMPKKYWNNLPEAALIPSLIQTAKTRERMMMDSLNHEPNPIAEKATYQPDQTDEDLSPPDIAALWEQVEACRRCDLWEGATQGVAGVGPDNARLMIVGEQPGDKEDLAGEPFVGPAGQILTQALEEAGLSRETSYVTNAVKHFKYEVRGQRRIHKNPSVSEIKACNVWLEREIELVKPDIVLCLGGSAARAINGRPVKVGENRGRVLERPDGLKFFITSHPSYILRVQRYEDAPTAYPQMVADLRKVAALLAA
ncbi:UdgX family uracil-DNA binding protein [uncultured Algimonas sp.]|uniref:UdgX family uracil-DNA binding protein n=1 Tax=uncultured Algimonas sp. TaxID=1547920 RepID=UPI0026203159|nr:UdgX family uracil-DNA binding protein [uncultured Algimonas sp.]